MAIYTTEQYTALAAAIAQGALRVEYADKRVEYRSLTEMMQILNMMKTDLGLTDVNSGRRYASFSKGL